jgi:hypothetical protein
MDRYVKSALYSRVWETEEIVEMILKDFRSTSMCDRAEYVKELIGMVDKEMLTEYVSNTVLNALTAIVKEHVHLLDKRSIKSIQSFLIS